MINRTNLRDIIERNKSLILSVSKKVEEVESLGLSFKLTPIEAIKRYLENKANLIMFPSDDLEYGGLVTYKHGRFYIHINTNQPKTYENFIWAHEFYHFYFESKEIMNSEVKTFADGSFPSEEERCANLFSAELLINKHVLQETFNDISNTFKEDTLSNRVVRLIESFKLPYKCIVIKLVQDGLISLDEAEEIIDYDYRNNLPGDFDHSLLTSSRSVSFDSVARLLNDDVVKENLSSSDLEKIESNYTTRMKQLGGTDR
ncbi:ImmA/IrrE family metallo-endopeptidase [Kurthia sibirica]|uniref:IrrE N-terminal-like domain-containing protein n=1 Tax=Kurthia sibirica TaxID=202750 RepID=A0A2U3AKC1_9BACL|nr:ImmA/IrrE family metallo-endopeptidase [Kurthia sibirica]PWI24988.1 hypothetical protein DEX24_10460 [Kurthia sibirica]GEK33106.1 hypothetical protein KSI01_06390 [Kurthia sibirica]